MSTPNTANKSTKKGGSFYYMLAAAGAGGIGYYLTVNKTNPIKTSALNPKEFTPFELKEVQDVNHNTKLFRFKLEDNEKLGLSVASLVLVRAPSKDGKGYVMRPYTPTSDEEQTGFFDFVIKHYQNGPMSTHIFGLKPGDKLEVKGPFDKIKYEANKFDEVGMLAGGTGITPMLQILRKAFKDQKDKTKITLVFANRSEQDILFKKELDELQNKHKDRFKVHYVVDKKTSSEFDGSEGYINKQIVDQYMPKQNQNSMIFVCGPDQMYSAVCGTKNPDKSQGELKGLLKEMGYNKDSVFKF